jgi:hypothetical protein
VVKAWKAAKRRRDLVIEGILNQVTR